MNHTVISVENVSKYYRLGLIGGGTLHDDFERWWAKTRGKPDPLLKIGQEEQGNRQGEYIWALRDVSFEVQQGEVLGIIGRNGAGKSTLLKILSRVTAPTSGQVKIKGRVASLLEVGTGFHPELTGRENIYLNGAILGMKKAEIERKFDEIVAFAEIEKFLDTPVKRYSSGMYVRLAFAVAAHLESEILLVDEVLAVGDAAFQKKCLGKLGQVAQEGRTVLFVSHNLGAIRRLCQETIVVDRGFLIMHGDPGAMIDAYLARISGNELSGGLSAHFNVGSGEAGFTDVWFEGAMGRTSSVLSGGPLNICLRYQTTKDRTAFEWGISLYDSAGESIIHFGSIYSRSDKHPLPLSGVITCNIPRLPLPEGRYRLNASMHIDGKYLDHVVGAAYLDVHGGDFYGTGRVPPSSTCKVMVDHSWHIMEE